MASSEKAGALKNAFVNAISNELGEEAMAEAGAMENAKLAGKLGLDLGDVAAVHYDLDRGEIFGKNDGDDSQWSHRGGKKYRMSRDSANMYPITGADIGKFKNMGKMTPRMHQHASESLNRRIDDFVPIR